MSVVLHVLNADPELAPHAAALAEAAERALRLIEPHLPLSDIDIVMIRNPFATIPQLGIGGFSPNGHLVQVSVDPAHAAFDDVLEEHLSRTLAHELHHCLRWRGPGYGSTLGEALVSEGLADHFDLEVHPGAEPYHWSTGLENRQLREAWELARPALWEADYDHAAWFFNTSEDGLPYHAGYALGFQLVGEYLRADAQRRPSELVAAPARDVLENR